MSKRTKVYAVETCDIYDYDNYTKNPKRARINYYKAPTQ